jgi:hypothetical protein
MRRSYVEGSSLAESSEWLIASIVKGRTFSIGIACLIVVSTVMIGIETQLLSSLSERNSGSEQWITVLAATNYALTFLFTVEMVARLYVFRLDFFIYERVWNLFDVLILLLALVEVALEVGMYAFSGRNIDLSDQGGSSKVLRLFRLTRLLRLVRTFRQLKPLRVLLHSLYCAGKSVFWALLLLVTIIYSFGVILTQAVTEHTEGGTQVEEEDLLAYYGDLYRSMRSLWWAISGGINWYELTGPLETTGNVVWSLLFLVYIAFVYFFILNVVTGVFCQNAIEGAQQDLELTIETQLKEKEVYADRLRKLFEEMNTNPNGVSDGLTPAEIQKQLDRPKVQSWFKALDVDAKKAWKLFKILDEKNTGRVSLDDFVEGCLKLKGPATRVDVETLKWEIREANNRAEHAAGRLADLIEGAFESRVPSRVEGLDPGRKRLHSVDDGGESESNET